jgi:multidrug resistance protein
MFAPGIRRILAEFHETSPTVATFILSVYILGFAFGPLIIAPMSEIYGRSPLYNIGNVLFTVFSICTALSNSIGMMMAFRFLMGVAGSVPITIGSGSIADIMPVEMRGRAMAAWALGPLLGPCIGPVAGGYLIRAAGWRWVYWLIAILAGIVSVFTFFTLKESYAPVILERKAARLRKETGNQALRSELADLSGHAVEKIKVAIVRPLRLLFLTPIVTLMSFYVAITCKPVSCCLIPPTAAISNASADGILYLLFSTFSLVYPQYYGFGEGESGLVFIPTAIGMMFGISIFGALSDKLVKAKLDSGEQHRPEIRLLPWLTLPAGLTIPVGLFLYGWTIQYRVHWIVPMLGSLIFAFGLMGVMVRAVSPHDLEWNGYANNFLVLPEQMCIQNYLLDLYPRQAASVTAATAVLRSLAGALLPLCALEMYEALDMGWGNSLLGFISLGLAPIPLLFYTFGARIVKRSQPKD